MHKARRSSKRQPRPSAERSFKQFSGKNKNDKNGSLNKDSYRKLHYKLLSSVYTKSRKIGLSDWAEGSRLLDSPRASTLLPQPSFHEPFRPSQALPKTLNKSVKFFSKSKLTQLFGVKRRWRFLRFIRPLCTPFQNCLLGGGARRYLGCYRVLQWLL